MMKLYRLFGLITLAWLYSSGLGYAQCTGGTAWDSFTLPTNNTPAVGLGSAWITEYDTFDVLAVGETYQFDAAAYMTISDDATNTAIVFGLNTVTFTPTATGTYRIHFFESAACDGAVSDFGDLTVTCTTCPAPPPPPANDLCTGAIDIACGGSATGSTEFATPDTEAECITDDGSNGVWYRFVGTGDLIEASLCGSSYDTKIRIYEGTCGALTCVTGNDDNSATCGTFGPSFASFISTVGTEYFILVHGFEDGFSGPNNGDYQLDITCISCPDPSDLSASNITENQAELSWTAGNAETLWDIEYGAPGFALGSGTTVPGVSNPHTLTGLTIDTEYEYYVRADCGGGDNSNWVGPFAFKTACAAITSMPFTETFEDASTTRGCWSQEQVTGTQSWTFGAGAGGGAISSAYEGSTNARFTSSGGTADVTRFITPTLDITGLTEPVLTFYYGQEEWFGDQNELRVYYRISPSDPWVEIFSDVSNVNAWTPSPTLALPNPSATYQIAFEGTDNFGRRNVLDLVVVQEKPCPVPLNVEASPSFDAVTISWTSDPDATTWDIEYGAPGFALGSGTTAPGVTNPHTITGLASETDYEFYIRGNCGGTLGDSEWAGPFTFTTLCPPANTFPFLETFEDASTTRDCWSQQQVTGANSWSYAAGSSGGNITTAYDGALNARFTSSGGTAEVTRLISPLMDITGLTQPALKFLYGQENWAGDQNTLTVYYRANPADAWQVLFTDFGNVADWTCSPVLDLPNPSATYQLAFEATDNFGRANVLDNILVEDKAPAVAITGGDPAVVIANGSTTTSAADGTNFGILSVGLGETNQNDFVLRNDGTETLEVSAINVNAITGGDFTLIAPVAGDFPLSIAPCEEIVLQIEAAPTQGGIISANIEIVSNAPTFTFLVEAEGIAPRLLMRGGAGSVEIPTGHTTPSTTDGTLFGTVEVGNTEESMLILENAGNEPLVVSRVNVTGVNPGDFFVSAAPTGGVAGGATPAFNVVFEPTTNGTRSAIIEVYSNDPNNNPYTFTVQGEATGVEVTSLSAELLADLVVYPNPSEGVFRVRVEGNKTSEGVIEVFDARGSLVYSKKVRLVAGEAEFDLSGVAAGKYTAVIRLGEQQTSRHLIKR